MKKTFWEFEPFFQYPRAKMVTKLLKALQNPNQEKACYFFEQKIKMANSPWYKKILFNEKELFESLFSEPYEKHQHLLELKKEYFKPHPQEIKKKALQIYQGEHLDDFCKIIDYTYDLRNENQDTPDITCFERALSHYSHSPATKDYLKIA